MWRLDDQEFSKTQTTKEDHEKLQRKTMKKSLALTLARIPIAMMLLSFLALAITSASAASHGSGAAHRTTADSTTLYIVRHGQTDWNKEGKIQGNTDNPLNETGLGQARAIAEQLGGLELDHVYPSALVRARMTAETIAGSSPVTPDPRFNERSRGVYEGRIASEVNEEFRPRFSDLDDDMDGGESLRSISQRVAEATREMVAQHKGQTIMMVGHSGVNPLVIGELIGLPPERAIAEIRQGNDEVYKLIISPDDKISIWKLIPEDKLEEL